MEDQVTKLIGLITERDEIIQDYNLQIAEHVAPTLIRAIITVLGVQLDHIEWVDAAVAEDNFIIAVNVTYDPNTNTSPFLYTRESDVEAEILVQKMLRIGIPLEYVFSEVPTIVDYLVDVSQVYLAKQEELERDHVPDLTQYSFNMSRLTEEQKQQMEFFQYMNPGVAKQ